MNAVATDAGAGRTARWRAITVLLATAAFGLALWNARDQFFIWDEWDYWVQRHWLAEAHEYRALFFGQHGGHPVCLTMALWLPLDWLFGAKRYVPYVIPTILAHSLAGFLLFELLRGARLRPAVAALTAGVYLFLGAAAGNLSFAWQIGFVAPIVCTYLGLLGLQRRTVTWRAIAVASAIVAVATSGVGLTVLAVFAVAAVLWRKTFLGVFMVIVPGALFALWQRAYAAVVFPFDSGLIGAYLRFADSMITAAVMGLLQIEVPTVAWLVLVAATVATVVTVAERDPSAPVFAATLCGAAFFSLSVASQRVVGEWGGPHSARYLHIVCALVLPSFALLVDRLIRLRRWSGAVAMAVVLWVVPGNVQSLLRWNEKYVATGQQIRARIAASAALGPRLAAVPGGLQPYGREAPGLNVDVVRRLGAEGKIPCETRIDEIVELARQLSVPLPDPTTVTCPR